MCDSCLDMDRYCNFCKHAIKQIIGTEVNSRYNIYCFKYTNKVLVDSSIKYTDFAEIPNWCPLGKNNIKKLSYAEKIDKLKEMKPFMKWENIQEGKVYHIPQIPGEERRDIYIMTKTSYFLTYRLIGDENRCSYTMYPSSLASKFLIENKLKKFIISKK